MVWDGCWSIYDRINKGYNYDNHGLKCNKINEKIEGEKEMGNNEKKNNVNFGDDANAGMSRDDSSTSTRLLDKNWSPLIVRKYQMLGWPLFISLITDSNLNDLDNVVYDIHEEAIKLGFTDGKIQSLRNYAGFMSDKLVEHYNKIKKGTVEGVAVVFYQDKIFCSSLYGDFMVHQSCKIELFQIINTLPHI